MKSMLRCEKVLRLIKGVANGGSPFKTHYQQYDGKYDGGTYLFAVEPIVMLAIYEYEYNTYQPQAP